MYAAAEATAKMGNVAKSPMRHITTPSIPRPTPARTRRNTSAFWPFVAFQLAFMASKGPILASTR